ncbi:MAG: alkaline phosphatase family protein [Bacteroidota bacterium]
MKIHFLSILTFAVVVTLHSQIPGEKDNRVLLPNGWWLSPAGEQIRLGDFPMNAALSEDEKCLAISHSGQSKAEIWLMDLKAKKNLQKIELPDTWYGIKFSGKKLYVSGGYQNCVFTFNLKKGRLVIADTIYFAESRPKYNGSLQGLDIQKNLLAVVFRNDSTFRVMDLKLKKQEIVKLDGMPYTCVFLKDGSAMVSIWGSKKVEVFKKMMLQYEIQTGDHPNEITLSRDGRFAYIACSNDNTVSVIDIIKKKAIASVSTAIHPDAPEGSTTNSIALIQDQKKILAANADNNSLTVIDFKKMDKPVPIGFIPVGWYPTKVMVLKNKTVLVLNGKGSRSFANPDGRYIASLMEGSLSIFPMPDKKKLIDYSKQVFSNTPYKHEQLLKVPFLDESAIPHKVGDPSPIKHIFYIIKENRTYDQVLGDMKEGNGDSSLCIFGEKVTPNHHKLAREFALFDNFYVNSEVSADGHNWSMAGYATDYIEKTWPTQYGGRGGEYDFEGGQVAGAPTSGYLWTLAAKHNVSFRSYGEFITANKIIGKPGVSREKGLEGHFAPFYRGWDLNYSDVDRFKEWNKEFSEFEKNGTLPQICIMHLPNDHTAGSKKGALSPRAYVAQNDCGLGLIVDRISKSKFWMESAIFVLEDDAQNGPDHVDAHRSVCLVISPFIKKHDINHTLYTTASMLRTMELILGLPPMSQYDAAATPMFNAFTTLADTARYTAEEPRWDLTERNKGGSFGEALMDKFNLKKEDDVPDREFNEIIWRVVTGKPMPAPRYSIFSRKMVSEERD